MNFNKVFTYVASFMLAIIIVSGIMSGHAQQVMAKDSSGDIVIVIDPGHGGYDGGAIGSLDKEADLNWAIAKYMKAELETYAGVKVFVTRGSNEWHTNTGRGQFVKSVNADFFISIHNNSSSNSGTSGFVAYGSVSPNYVEATKNMCLNMARYAQAAGLNLFSGGYLTRQSTTDPNRDFYTAIDEGILSGVPSIIVEHSFVTNASDQAFMHDAYNQQKVGVADATAVAEYFGLSKRTITDGQSLNLERSYSAYFVPSNRLNQAVTFSSSNSDIAYVRSDGLITAVNPGSAQITYTYADGTSGSCSINVNPVVMVGLSAGINPTVHLTPESVAAIDKSTAIVKAIYSDGTSYQIFSGYTIGDFDPNIWGRQFVDVESNGFKCQLMINLDPYFEAGDYSLYLYQLNGTNSDIFVLPPLVSIEGVTGSPFTNPGSDIPAYVEPETTTEAVTETVTETTSAEETTTSVSVEETTEAAPTEETTDAIFEVETTGEASGEGTTEVSSSEGSAETVSSQEYTESESVDEITKPATKEEPSSSKSDSKKDVSVIVILVVLIVAMCALIVVVVLAVLRENRRHKGEPVKRIKRKKH